MVHRIADLLVVGLGLYLAVGLLFAIAFVLFGAGRLDPAARQGTWGFRLLILPGSAALWPWLALRWARRRAPEPCDAHRLAARSAEGAEARRAEGSR